MQFLGEQGRYGLNCALPPPLHVYAEVLIPASLNVTLLGDRFLTEIIKLKMRSLGFPSSARGKELSCARVVRDAGSVLGLGRYPSEGHGNPFQYFSLENTMDRGAWATVNGV